MLEIVEHDRIREIRLNRPPVNAMNTALLEVLQQALRQAHEEADAIVLSGRPGLFSAGLDIPALLQLDQTGMQEFWAQFMAVIKVLGQSPVPVVCAITGHCPAGGAVLSLFCDYRVMAEGQYKIGLNEVQVGLVVPELIQMAYRRVIGGYRAERLLLHGTMLDAQAAASIGLVDELQPDAAVIEASLQWCRTTLALPRSAMLKTRAMARAGLVAALDDPQKLSGDEFLAFWFDPATQQTLQQFVTRLHERSTR